MGLHESLVQSKSPKHVVSFMFSLLVTPRHVVFASELSEKLTKIGRGLTPKIASTSCREKRGVDLRLA